MADVEIFDKAGKRCVTVEPYTEVVYETGWEEALMTGDWSKHKREVIPIAPTLSKNQAILEAHRIRTERLQPKTPLAP
ncbi:MAG: hypothetical protein UX80_C0012G0006 [Candidatus Amesbacteria bacterium GW2011_GWA2_47_11b]|uniref:Uncharacterized protein n=3 Tax=Candidatus Amesiibacteriota TaxID=1752730 RepID=A0A0G1SJS5_9BACT|nr:MAG: hypothetical protein UX42_C0010G0006 [Microgenomates group bacterium GW2011_GWC1_46_20]KKU57599.1 MAG: hypothetical protein UX80_C0012G0006 [Candidatus Amesbacteria bacterium GW2011_GWA2_47_11b]KKU69667.1 MAG: hypothetical protein UX92_C0012G0010 [Candidatus Amesbacteria bacterium GW2011_GWA1_47_20]KKU83023.1 MAG: hypothetical protein UY11_C0032G0019 [Candidatus Amesbacteria bacterium GW2011_GWC2_47_8]